MTGLGGFTLAAWPTANSEGLLGQFSDPDGAEQIINADGDTAITENETTYMNANSPDLVAERTKRFLQHIL